MGRLGHSPSPLAAATEVITKTYSEISTVASAGIWSLAARVEFYATFSRKHLR